MNGVSARTFLMRWAEIQHSEERQGPLSQIAQKSVQNLVGAIFGIYPGALALGIDQPNSWNTELEVVIDFVLYIGGAVLRRENLDGEASWR